VEIPSPASVESPELTLNRILTANEGLSLATAESCTGGNVAARLTSVPGSSLYFMGGLVAYDNDVKSRLLQVSAEVLSQFGAVSPECAREMAEGARALFDADFSVSTTGVAGPGGASRRKPAGLVYIGVAASDSTETFEHHFDGDRHQVVAQATEEALQALRRAVGARLNESIHPR
jgi:PncC family amidohydrolase